MSEQERDIVELETEDGEKVALEVERYFYYNGEEYVLLCDAENRKDRYIMKVVPAPDEDGEEMEDFEPIDDDLCEQLIQVIETNFGGEETED